MSRSEQLLQIHIVVLVIISTLLLGNGLNSIYIPSIGITAAVFAFIFTERLGWIRLHRFIANVLTLIVAGLSINQFFDETTISGDVKLSSIANLLTYVQVVLLFQQKTPRLYWNIWVLSLLQVVVAAALSLHFQVGILFFLFFLISLSAMMLMSVYVDAAETNEQSKAHRRKKQSGKTLSAARMRKQFVAARSKKPVGYGETNLNNRKPLRLIGITLTSGMVATIFAWILFFSVPRHNDTWYGTGSSIRTSRVGFSEGNMKYNHSATIANNHRNVFRAFFHDEQGAPIKLATEPYFRGMVIQHCHVGRSGQIEWVPRSTGHRLYRESVEPMRNREAVPQSVVCLARQRIVLEPTSNQVLFSMKPHYRPIRTPDEELVLANFNNVDYVYGTAKLVIEQPENLEERSHPDKKAFNNGATWRKIKAVDRNNNSVVLAEGTRRSVLLNLVEELNDQFAMGDLEFDQRLDKLLRKEQDYKGAPFKYELTVPLYFRNRPLPATPAKTAPHRRTVMLPADAKTRIPSIFAAAQEVIDKLGTEAVSQRLLAFRMSEYFAASELFTYTLDYMDMETDETLDPLEDFMRNRKAGHCEYYAGALAAMLRTQGIPSRIVRGYKGGIYNDLGQYYQVRESDCHAWVEAFLPVEESSEQMINSGQVGFAGCWYRLDPVIHDATQMSYASHEKGMVDKLGDVWGYARTIWEDYLVGMDAREQQGNLFAPQEGGILGAKLKDSGWVKKIKSLKFPVSKQQLFDPRTLALITLLLLALTLSVRLTRRRLSAVHQNGRRQPSKIRSMIAAVSPNWARNLLGLADDANPSVEFYEKFLLVLDRHNLKPSFAQTGNEFVQQSLEHINANGGDSDQNVRNEKLGQIRSMLEKVTDAFYRVRYGGRDLPQDVQQDIDQTIQQLQVELSSWQQNKVKTKSG